MTHVQLTHQQSTSGLQPGRQRAMDADEKIARKQAIVDATERLYSRGQVLPGVGEVAAEAGMAKGTIYLYFETKEALYLALHQRHAGKLFETLIARLDKPEAFSVEVMLGLVNEHMLDNPNFLPLCNVCMSALTTSYNPTTHEAFHVQIGTWLSKAGGGLEVKFPKLLPGDGVRLLYHGYGLILGLYQLLGRGAEHGAARHCKPQLPQLGSFRAEAHAALRVYWQQAISLGLPTLSPGANQ